MQITLEELILKITREVIRELGRQNISVTIGEQSVQSSHQPGLISHTETIDMSKYKTPVLTENHIQKLHELTGEVIIPKGTVITPKARELVRHKNLKITIK
jgi:hypothetical protein